MTRKDLAWFITSIVISFLAWSYFISWTFGLVVLTALMIHEYGHYYWMSKEGIINRSMLALPLLGAVAISREAWASRGSETRIALAGPFFGIFSVILFYALWFITNIDIFGAAVILACYINLFNLLLPIPFLDGGRVVKSYLFTVNKNIGILFYYFGFVVIIYLLLLGYFSIFISFFLAFILWNDYQQLQIPHILNLRPLSLVEIISGFFIYAGMVLIYFVTLSHMNDYPNISLELLF